MNFKLTFTNKDDWIHFVFDFIEELCYMVKLTIISIHNDPLILLSFWGSPEKLILWL